MKAVALFLILLSVPALAAKAPALTAVERDTLRYHLQNLYNEQDLLIRNQFSDHADIQRQDRDLRELKVYERIPFQEDIPELKAQLAESAREHHLRLTSFKVTGKTKPARKLPEYLYTDRPGFQLKPEDLAEEIRFTATVATDPGIRADAKDQVAAWMGSWQEDLMRLVEPEGGSKARPVRQLPNGSWSVNAHGFRFWDIKFPSLRARDPIELLPAWARRAPERFTETEPELWKIVVRTRDLIPKARSLYRAREELLLDGARMDFFLSKATPSR